MDNMRDDFGLNPGKNFHNWLTGLLKERGVETWGKLKLLRQQGNEKLKLRNGKPYTSIP
ncbi:hypothetical protein ACFS7Z_03115 [Pontibacter toksunensis]|uniref:Uncharacterized protein n=1 Tax=Pontibacter toksunensis TaxID=1332631 RepID=A0ABW6BNC0_9BACT